MNEVIEKVEDIETKINLTKVSTNIKRNQKIIAIQNMLMYFFISAFLGWVLETLFAIMVGNNEKRGFLYSPICPIYGFGAILLVYVDNILKRKKVKNDFIKFIAFALSFTVLEYLSSLILELLFNQRWWDYSDLFLNIQGRVSLVYSIAFGIIGIVFTKLIKKPILKLIKQIRRKIRTDRVQITINLILILFIIDIVFSCIRYG